MIGIDQTHACTYCQAIGSKIMYPLQDTQGDQYLLHQCGQCRAVFLGPPPSAAQLAAAYNDDYYGEQEDKFESWIEKVLDFFRRKRAKAITKHLSPQAKVLDIGCGNGRFLQYMQQTGNIQAYGIELPGKAAQRAAQIEGIHLKEGVLEKGDFEANFFDAITLVHVFEHLANPQETLDIIQHIVKPGGIVAIYLPNIDSFQSRFFKGKWLHADPPRHLFFFEPQDLKREMKRLGFQTIQESYFNPEYNPYGMQQSLLNMLFPQKRELLYEHLKGNTTYTKDYSTTNLFLQKLFCQVTYPLFIVSDLIESGLGRGATFCFVFKKNW